jgi:hypothetical protein
MSCNFIFDVTQDKVPTLYPFCPPNVTLSLSKCSRRIAKMVWIFNYQNICEGGLKYNCYNISSTRIASLRILLQHFDRLRVTTDRLRSNNTRNYYVQHSVQLIDNVLFLHKSVTSWKLRLILTLGKI